MTSAEIDRLTLLLQKAADAIRAERSKNDQLRAENDALRGKARAPSQDAVALQSQLRALKEDYRLLSIENELAVGQIAGLREENARLRQEALTRQTKPNMSESILRANTSISSSRDRVSARSHSATAALVPTADTKTSSPKRHSSELFSKLKARSRGEASVAAVLHPSAGDSVMVPHKAGDYPITNDPTDLALNRLRRSMAPPPTKEQMDEVIKAMVAEIQSQLASKGLNLPMRRLKECCYESGKKRFNLSVDSNRLMVKCGGGNVDFLEYIERNKLCHDA